MKYLLPILLVFFLMACKKEQGLPQLSFTNEDKQWMIYETGQQFKFKNDQGDSLVYTVTYLAHDTHDAEYKDTSYTVVAYTESYYVQLTAADDSIVIILYKQWHNNPEPNKLRQFIRWVRVKYGGVILGAIYYNTPFTSRTVNGKTYTRVTEALPPQDIVDPFTKFDRAYYDQQSGFIEIIDLKGVSWKRV
jgi:hypothetical protein